MSLNPPALNSVVKPAQGVSRGLADTPVWFERHRSDTSACCSGPGLRLGFLGRRKESDQLLDQTPREVLGSHF